MPFAPERNNIFLQHVELRRKGIVWEICPEEAHKLFYLSLSTTSIKIDKMLEWQEYSVSSTASLELYFEWHWANRVNGDSNVFSVAVALCNGDGDVLLVVSEMVLHKHFMLVV